MVEYIIVALVLLYGLINYDILGKKDKRNTWLYLEWLLLVLLVGLRYKVGGDTILYQEQFESNVDTWRDVEVFGDSRYGFLWTSFVIICKKIVNSFYFLQIVHAIITNTVFLWFFKKHTSRYFTANLLYFLLYYLNYNTEVLRATLAVCCFLLAFDFLKKKKYVYYYLLCAIGVGFHIEAIITLIFPILTLFNRTKISFISLSVLIAISYATMAAMNFIPIISNLFASLEQVQNALDYYSDVSSGEVSILGYIFEIVMQFPILYCIWVYKYRESDGFKGFMFLFYLITVQTFSYRVIASRLLVFFYPIFLVVLVSSIKPSYYRNKIKYSLNNSLIILFCVFLLLFNMGYKWTGEMRWFMYYPYSSIYDPVDYPIRDYLHSVYQERY